MYIISESFIQWAFAMAMASLSRVRRKSCSRRSRHSNYQPNRPPTSVLLVLKIKFLANILANVRCVIKGIAEVASFGTRRPVCPATENHVLGDIKNPRPEKSRHIRSRGGEHCFRNIIRVSRRSNSRYGPSSAWASSGISKPRRTTFRRTQSRGLADSCSRSRSLRSDLR